MQADNPDDILAIHEMCRPFNLLSKLIIIAELVGEVGYDLAKRDELALYQELLGVHHTLDNLKETCLQRFFGEMFPDC